MTKMRIGWSVLAIVVGLLGLGAGDVISLDEDHQTESVWENQEEEEKNPCDRADMFLCQRDPDECIPLENICNEISECASGKDESVETCGCLPQEFQCNSTVCIDIIRRCDTTDDCTEGNDETDCKTYICPATHMKCDNDKCVPREAKCNFLDECGDGSDENNCLYRQCHGTEVRCNNSQCLAPIFLCDGEKNCADGSDEINCEEHVQCDRGLYVHKKRVCDGWVDCEYNHLDEVNCGDCTEAEYRCETGRCIHKANVCDGICDCIRSCDDEAACGDILCSPGERYLCPKTNRCIEKKYLCDGVNDCWNTVAGADEFFCWNQTIDCKDFKHANIASNPFVCPEGRCLPMVFFNKSIQCNFIADCLAGEDEADCEYAQCSRIQFRCQNGECIDIPQRCNGVVDCYDRSDEAGCESISCPDDDRKCASGHCISADKWCDFERDCPDNSDEKHCERRSCLPSEFECVNKQCVSRDVVCYQGNNMSEHGCVDLSHLHNCYQWACGPNQFKCMNSYCIDQSQVCDMVPNCAMSYWDELHCPFACPSPGFECICEDIEMNCEGRGLHRLPATEEESYSKYRLSGNYLNWTLTQDTFRNYERLTFLDLSNNSLSQISPFIFSSLWRLTVLNLENNTLKRIRHETFSGLVNVKQLYIAGNEISQMDPGAFSGLTNLRALDLSYQSIQTVEMNTFNNLRSVLNLNLSHNSIRYIANGAFNGLRNLIAVDISGNPMEVIEQHVFHGLPHLKHLYTDEFRFCCLVQGIICSAKPDEFSSCQDLMSNYFLRISIWILGMVASFGNLLVIGWRVRDFRSGKVHTFLITNLALGDFLMGVYLMIVAVVDSYYRGVYIIHDEEWRNSALCKVAGFLSTFSSEISVFTLTVITLDRLVCIIFPFNISRLGLKQARIVMCILWIIVFFLSGVPFLKLDYFGNFYGRSGVCLALHITPDRPSGWEYSVFLFIGLNFASFLTIAVSYFWMFIVAKKTHSAVRAPETKADNAMARRMTMIVMTDFFCWVPIVLLGIASLAGAKIPPEVYAWIAVFILPLNSAINPVLYTLSTAPFLMNMQKRASYVRKSFIGSVNGDTRHTYTEESRSQYFERSRSHSQYRQMELIRLRSLNRSPIKSPQTTLAVNPDETDDSATSDRLHPVNNKAATTDTDSEW